MSQNFKVFRKKKHLEMVLQNIDMHSHPKVELEQYSTPSFIAADILWTAASLGDIKNKIVADLGCGTGIFSIGSALLGAEQVSGIDKDQEALLQAQKNSKILGLTNIDFYKLDVVELPRNLKDKFDTVIQNPPFGSQSRSKKGADRIFMEKSLQLAPVVYSFHMAETENFLENYWHQLGSKITHKFYYHFPLPKIYHFHQKEVKEIEVIVQRVKRNRH